MKRTLLLAAFLTAVLCWPDSIHAIASAFVQITAICHHATGSGACPAFGTNNTSGNTILIPVICGATCTQAALPSDTRGNTYVQKATCTPSVNNNETFYLYEADGIAAGANTITMNFTSSFWEGYPSEYSGLAASAFDKSICADAASGTALSSGNTATTSFANELVLGMGASGSGTLSVGSGYTQRANTGFNFNEIVEDKNVTSTGAQACTATIAPSRSWYIGCWTFKDASQPAAGTRKIIVVN